MCYRWTSLAVLAVFSMFTSVFWGDYPEELSFPMLSSCIATLSITVAIIALYHRDFLSEMETFMSSESKKTRLAGYKVARDYKENFALLFITVLLLVIATSLFIVVNFISESIWFKGGGLWSFITAIGSLVVFVITLTLRLFLDARFFESVFIGH